jgi:hypothetical protein
VDLKKWCILEKHGKGSHPRPTGRGMGLSGFLQNIEYRIFGFGNIGLYLEMYYK